MREKPKIEVSEPKKAKEKILSKEEKIEIEEKIRELKKKGGRGEAAKLAEESGMYGKALGCYKYEGDIDGMLQMAKKLGVEEKMENFLKKDIIKELTSPELLVGDIYALDEEIPEYGKKLGMSEREIELWRNKTDEMHENFLKESEEVDRIMEEWWEREGRKQFEEDTEHPGGF